MQTGGGEGAREQISGRRDADADWMRPPAIMP